MVRTRLAALQNAVGIQQTCPEPENDDGPIDAVLRGMDPSAESQGQPAVIAGGEEFFQKFSGLGIGRRCFQDLHRRLRTHHARIFGSKLEEVLLHGRIHSVTLVPQG